MFLFVSGGYNCGNNKPGTAANRALKKHFKHGMFVATTSEDVGRCTVQPELSTSNDSTRCVPDKEAGEEERYGRCNYDGLNCLQT